jgi:hypothetical protein
MSRHVMDHTPARSATGIKQFLRLARTPRETWHRKHAATGSSRIVQFLRILRGRSA